MSGGSGSEQFYDELPQTADNDNTHDTTTTGSTNRLLRRRRRFILDLKTAGKPNDGGGGGGGAWWGGGNEKTTTATDRGPKRIAIDFLIPPIVSSDNSTNGTASVTASNSSSTPRIRQVPNVPACFLELDVVGFTGRIRIQQLLPTDDDYHVEQSTTILTPKKKESSGSVRFSSEIGNQYKGDDYDDDDDNSFSEMWYETKSATSTPNLNTNKASPMHKQESFVSGFLRSIAGEQNEAIVNTPSSMSEGAHDGHRGRGFGRSHRGDDDDDDRPVSFRLHELCAEPDATLEELQEALMEDPTAVKRPDTMGQMPLHILGCNVYADPTVVQLFTVQLLTLNPSILWTVPEQVPELDDQALAIVSHPPNTFIPFVQPIYEWIHSVYMKKKKKKRRYGDGSSTRGLFIEDDHDSPQRGRRRRCHRGYHSSSSCEDGDVLGVLGNISSFQRHLHLFSRQASSRRGLGTLSSTAARRRSTTSTANTHGPSGPTSNGTITTTTMMEDNITANTAATNTTSLDPNELRKQVRRFPRRVELSDAARFAFDMLSLCMDFLCSSENLSAQMSTERSADLTDSRRGGFGGNDVGGNSSSSMNLNDYSVQLKQRQQFAEQVAQIPLLLKTIFLIEDDETRLRLLNTSIMKRVLLCPESLGRWLLHMLTRTGLPSRRAVDYFHTLSSVSTQEFCCSGVVRTPVASDVKAFEECRSECLEILEGYNDIIPSLFVLPEREIERAAATSIVWDVLNDALARPFVIGIVIVDLVLHFTLLIAFRNSIQNRNLTNGESILGNAVPTIVVNAITTFFLVRKIAEALALLQISRSVLKNYLLDIFNIFDSLCIILTIYANSAPPDLKDERPVLNAIIIGLLWMKVLSFLKAINKQMATFILSLIQIIKDIRFFIVVLLVVIFMFGDMMHVVYTTTDDGKFCFDEEDNDGVQDFCSSEAGSSYLRMYAILIGDFEFSEYAQDSLAQSVFVIFTIVGVIILLNVLIAVVSNSYERSTEQAAFLFGRARVGFVAEHLALEKFLQPGTSPVQILLSQRKQDSVNDSGDDLDNPRLSFLRRCFMVLLQCVRWGVLGILIGCSFVANIFLVTNAVDVVKHRNSTLLVTIMLLFLAAVLTTAMWILFDFILRSPLEERLKQSQNVCLRSAMTWYGKTVKQTVAFFRKRLFGDMRRMQMAHEAEAEEEQAKQQFEQQQWMMDRLEELESRINASLIASEAHILDAVSGNT